MTTTVEYYFTLSSPWTFIGDPLIRDVCAKNGASINHRPVNFARVLDSTGGLPLAKRSDQRKALRMQELKRWRAYRGIDFNLEPKYFPVNDKAAAAVVLKAQQMDADVAPLVYAIMRSVWQDERDISDIDTLKQIADECGLDGKALIGAVDDPDILALWEENAETAIAKGVMGAPFYIVGEECFWGQDRVEFVDRYLASLR